MARRRSDKLSRQQGLDDTRAARRFVERLATLPETFQHPALSPLLDVDPYLSAWTNVEAALGNAPAPERERRLAVAAELDRKLRRVELTPEMKEAARRAVRALLARPWLLPPESFKFVYEPFETVIPAESL
jgi:hypothetical protein